MNDDRLQRMEEMMNQIHRGMFGDKPLKFPGLITTQDDHGRRLTRLEMWVFRIGVSGIASGGVIALIYKVATDWWPKH